MPVADIRLLILLATLSALLLAVAMQLVNRVMSRVPGVREMTWGASFSALGFTLIGLRGLVPDLFSILFGNTLVLAGMARGYCGLRLFLNYPGGHRIDVFAAVSALAGLAYFTYVEPSLAARVVVVSVVGAGLIFLQAWLLLASGNARADANRGMLVFLGLAFLAGCPVFAARGVQALFTAPGQDLMALTGTIHKLAFATVLTLNIVLTLGITYVLASRSERRQKTSEAQFRTALDSSPSAMFLVEADGLFAFANQQAERLLGHGPAKLSRTRYPEILAPESMAEVTAAFRRCLAGERVFLEAQLLHRDGHRVSVEISGAPLPGGKVLGEVRDISDRQRSAAELRGSEARYRLVAENASDVIWLFDLARDRYSYVSPSVAKMRGYSVEETLGQSMREALTPDSYAMVADTLPRRLADFAAGKAGARVQTHEVDVTRKDGGCVPTEVVTTLIADAAGRVTHIQGVSRDISERRKTEEALRLAASVFTHAREGILIADRDGRIIDVNQEFTRISGYDREELLGWDMQALRGEQHGGDFHAGVWRALREHGYWAGEIWIRRKSGEAFATMQTLSAVLDAQGHIRQYVALLSDITPLKENEKRLEHIAHFDALTNLPNRVLLADRLHLAMAQSLRHGQQLAVAYLDLDGFKSINDAHGHEIGDQLLIAVAGRMKRALREGDTIARLGGDEFVAVLIDLGEVDACVPLLDRLLAAAVLPVPLGDVLCHVSASIGVTFYPQAEEVDADQLLRQADQAMYQAKLAGKNRYHLFDAVQDRHVRGRHESLERIRRALAECEFVLHYQPKVNMRSGRILGVEALIRWRHPERGLLLPAEFLPTVENHALAVELDTWVIGTALVDLENWLDAGLDLPVSVNIGALSLQQAGFVERLRTLLAGHPRVKPGHLELEVLETSALEDMVETSRVMHACREMGVSFALDDFGTGYSSLTYLQRLPASHLKIDQSFVRDMLADAENIALLEGVLGLAGAFQRQVIAEGVETVAHGSLLLQLGCEVAQGFGIARPMPSAELPAWAATWHPHPVWAARPNPGAGEPPPP